MFTACHCVLGFFWDLYSLKTNSRLPILSHCLSLTLYFKNSVLEPWDDLPMNLIYFSCFRCNVWYLLATEPTTTLCNYTLAVNVISLESWFPFWILPICKEQVRVRFARLHPDEQPACGQSLAFNINPIWQAVETDWCWLSSILWWRQCDGGGVACPLLDKEGRSSLAAVEAERFGFSETHRICVGMKEWPQPHWTLWGSALGVARTRATNTAMLANLWWV